MNHSWTIQRRCPALVSWFVLLVVKFHFIFFHALSYYFPPSWEENLIDGNCSSIHSNDRSLTLYVYNDYVRIKQRRLYVTLTTYHIKIGYAECIKLRRATLNVEPCAGSRVAKIIDLSAPAALSPLHPRTTDKDALCCAAFTSLHFPHWRERETDDLYILFTRW